MTPAEMLDTIHGAPAVPGGADVIEQCTRRPGGSTRICLHRIKHGYIMPAEICAPCRKTLYELIDSVLPEEDR